jgi:transposase
MAPPVLAPSDCPGCVARDQVIASLRLRIAELARQHHRQAHPFRRDDVQPTAQPGADNPAEPPRDKQAPAKKPGRPKGHPAARRPLPSPTQVDRVIDVPCLECPECRVALTDPQTVVQYQTDLPPITPFVTQFNIETGWCPCCRQVRQGRHPEQISDARGIAGNTFGPVVLTMAAELKHRLGVPYRKICDCFATYCDLEICPATLVRAEQRLTELARPTYDLLIEALRRAGVVHADETGWRIRRASAWLWVFSSQDVTVYTIRTSRGHDVPEEVLGPDFDGYLIVDGLQSYDVLDCAKGRCNAHLLRRCKELAASAPANEAKHLEALRTLLQGAIDLAQRRPELTAAGYARRVQEVETRLDDWLDSNLRKRTLSPELDRLDGHIRKHRGEWLVFLHEAEVPPTTNHAERMLRPAVITRKVGGCNKTLLGAAVHSVLSSLMVTCKRQGRKFLDLAKRLWQAGEPQAVPLPKPSGQ